MKYILFFCLFLTSCQMPFSDKQPPEIEYTQVDEQARLDLVHDLLESKGTGSAKLSQEIEQEALEKISEEKLDSLIDTLFDDEGE